MRACAIAVSTLVLLALAPVASATLSWAPATLIDADDQPMLGVTCTVTDCVAVDRGGTELTFSEIAPGNPAARAIDPAPLTTALDDLACPSSTQCTAVGAGGEAVTFNPRSGVTQTSADIDGTHTLTGIACPSSGQCVAVDDSGFAFVFNPDAIAAPAAQPIDGIASLQRLSCPAVSASASQCTTVDGAGDAVTFVLAAGSAGLGTPAVQPIDNGRELDGVACPSIDQCTAVDESGNVISFDPEQSPVTPVVAGVDSEGLRAIACLSTSDCVAVGGGASAAEGNPGSPAGWALQQLPGADDVQAIACSAVSRCVAVDQAGQLSIGTPIPIDSTLPSIVGVGQLGQTLTEIHGAWQNAPATYAVQWQDCDGSGTHCTTIAGASRQSYTVLAADVGHTLRVIETAANPFGAGVPAVSAPTALVPPSAPISLSRPRLSGGTTVGDELSASGSWLGSGTLRFSYTWQRCTRHRCKTISGAAQATYILHTADAGARLQVTITATNAFGHASATSALSAVVRKRRRTG